MVITTAPNNYHSTTAKQPTRHGSDRQFVPDEEEETVFRREEYTRREEHGHGLQGTQELPRQTCRPPQQLFQQLPSLQQLSKQLFQQLFQQPFQQPFQQLPPHITTITTITLNTTATCIPTRHAVVFDGATVFWCLSPHRHRKTENYNHGFLKRQACRRDQLWSHDCTTALLRPNNWVWCPSGRRPFRKRVYPRNKPRQGARRPTTPRARRQATPRPCHPTCRRESTTRGRPKSARSTEQCHERMVLASPHVSGRICAV